MDWFESANEHLAKWKASNAASDAAWRKVFNPGALKGLELARKEADRLNRNYVGVEHILLGLTILGPQSPHNLLRKLGLNLEVLQSELEKEAGVGRVKIAPNNFSFTPRAKKVFETAKTDAKSVGGSRVGPGHLLSGLHNESEGCVAAVFKTLKLDRQDTRRRALEEMKSASPPSNHGATAESSG
jgi:ATP-dependent Clp protease ATP-binding subunit ClpC